MLETKIATKIRKTPLLKKKIAALKKGVTVIEQAKKGLKDFLDLFEEIDVLWDSNEAIRFEKKKITLYTELFLIMDDKEADKILLSGIRKDGCVVDARGEILDLRDCGLLCEKDVRKIFFEYSKSSRKNSYNQILCYDDTYRELGFIVQNGLFTKINDYIDRKHNMDSFFFSVSQKTTEAASKQRGLYDGVSTLRTPTGYSIKDNRKSKLQIVLEIGMPTKIKSKSLFNNLQNLYEKGYVIFSKREIKLSGLGREAVEKGICTQIGNVKIEKERNKRESVNISDNMVDISTLSTDDKNEVLSYYTQCDKIRANMSLYDSARLEDPNQGHWELWEGNEGDDLIRVGTNSKIYARNPKSDIKNDCIVGIDFGTKSTVVVCQNETGMIQPMQIGNGDTRKEIEGRDFENPTVMQFIYYSKFVKAYHKNKGRPNTKWEDLIISHAANESMQEVGVRSSEFYSYLYDLKQWAGEGSRTINMRDKKGNDIILHPYIDLVKSKKSFLDPIEAYAYYIGLYINNMNNGIYLDYILSFPVTYEKSVRNTILNSFEKGLKKSLPQSILDDVEVMKDFHVVAGSSEPAAYAICALEEYGFEPEEDEKVFYGIFDFGGGTTDFDFGLWTKSKEEELFDYSIEHFGTQGDRYLGGENLLQLLAFEIFAQNIQLCRDNRIPFAKPVEYINIPPQINGYVNDSQEARMNQKLMMERIRPFWERKDDDGETIDLTQFGEFQIGLFDVEGLLKSNLPFEVELDKLEEILVKRIEKGVNQFFESLKDTFSSKHINKTADANCINIFLAGNSSKSPILHDTFRKNIEIWNKKINSNDKLGNSFFILYPPLGTESAKKIQEERGIRIMSEFATPTGKTGVAWGLIEGREGGRIEVKEELKFENDTKFLYHIGIQKGKKFFAKINRDEEYMKWIRFLPAKRKINEFLYTGLPEAMSGSLSCLEIGVFRKRIELPIVCEGKYIFIRLVSNNIIEYAIGDEAGNIDIDTIKKEILTGGN